MAGAEALERGERFLVFLERRHEIRRRHGVLLRLWLRLLRNLHTFVVEALGLLEITDQNFVRR